MSNCGFSLHDGQSLMGVYQPTIIMMLVNLSEPWYSEKDLQILEELDHTLVGLIVASVVVFTTLIASSPTSALALFSTRGAND